MPPSITIKELHATTGEHVRRIGASRTPVLITDRGQPVAVLGSPSLFKPKRRTRVLLPEYVAMMAAAPGARVQDDLDAVRGDR